MTDARPRLSKSDWTDAALRAISGQGTAGVNVEQLARDLGTTKGSFYHHFENRQALLEAALTRWEEVVSADLVSAATIADPRERLIHSSLAGIDTELDGFVELALASDVDQPGVRATLRRINEKRIAYLSAILEELEVPGGLAQERALGGLATYVGLYHLQHVSGERLDAERLRAQIVHVVDAMLM